MLKASLVLLGLVTTGLGCYASFEQGLALEGKVSYLTLAAPVVALAFAFIPLFVERTWRTGHYIKSIFWVLVLMPVGAMVFFTAAERVHIARSSMGADNAAHRAAVTRAEKTLSELKAARDRAEADAKKARTLSRKQCDATCLGRWDDAFNQAVARVKQAEADVTSIQSKAVTDPPMQAPIWLWPVAVDSLAFMAFWSAFITPKPEEPKVARRRRRKAKKRTPPKRPVTPVRLHAVT